MVRPNRSVCRDEGSDRRQTRFVGKIARGNARPGGACLLADDRLNGIGNLFNEIAGDHAGKSQSTSRQVACRTMQIGRSTGCFPGRNALCEEADEHSGEHISRSRRGHSWVACRADHEQAIGSCDHRPGALQDDKDASFSGKTSGRAEAVGIDAL